MDIDDIHDEDPSLSAPSFRPRGTSDRSIDSGYYSNTSVGDTVALIDSRMRPLPSSSEPDHPFNASYQDFHFDSTAHNEQGPIRYENSGLMEPPRYESSYGTDPAYERNGQVYDAPTRKLSVPESLSTHHPERNGQGYDAPTQEFVPESTSIPRDDKLLSFQPTIHHFTLLDRSLRTMSVSLNADLHGMFFITDPQNPPGLLPELNPSEITCYRRNLFQVTGSITLSRGLLYILTNRGDRIPIVAQELTISVTESIENNTVKLISVPWKTPKEPAEKIEKEPSVLPLDLICHHDSDAEVATIPFAWKRLQFRIATVNNARRPELQQNFVVRLKLMVTLSTGDTTVVAEARSAAIIVRGRSPRNFQQRQDLPVIVEKVHEKPHPQIWPSECSNDIPEASQSVTAEDRTLIGHGLEGFAHSHDSDEISRLSNALAYSTDSATGVSSPMKGANRVPHKCSAAHAEVTTVLESLTAFRHPVNEDEENCGSSTSANGQPQTAFAQDLASDKDGNGHLSDEYEGSLSANEHSVKSGSENEYDSTSEGSVLNCSQRALISRLMDEICSLFFSQVSHRPRQRGQDGQGARDSSSDTTERTITSNHSSNQSSVSRRKRIHEDDEDPADEDNDEHKRRKTQDSNDVPSTRERYFACPFHKFDASIYGNGNEDPRLGLKYRSCGPPGWRTIGKLKEHLYRSHQTPIHCPRCWKITKTEAALGEHARASSQCDVLPPPLRWIPREVCEKLKNRKKAFAGQTDQDTWRYIFGLLFPECPNIPSPYYSDDITLEEATQKGSPTSNTIAAYEEYARAHLPRLVEEALETAVAEQTQPIEEGLRRALAGMVRDCHTQLAQNFLQHRSSNLSNVGGAGVQPEVLPSFYIEPLNLTEGTSFFNPIHISTNGQNLLQTRADSGYASVETSLNRDSSETLGDLSLQNNMGSFYGPTNDGYDNDGGPEIMSGPSDWAALMGNGQNFDFFSNGLEDKPM